MKVIVNNPTTIILTYIWIGCIFAISFLEAWLKFQAPGITLALGLGIGKLVFSALNKIEWIFIITMVITIAFSRSSLNSFQKYNYILLIPFIILLIQSTWLLPELSLRADKIIQGEYIEKSNLHFYYVEGEIIKITSLFFFGFKLFQKK